MSKSNLKPGVKGGPSPNPGGYTKAQAEARRLAAEFIRSETDGGRDILRFYVAVLRGEEKAEIAGEVRNIPTDSKSRCHAADVLADRLWGKSTVLVEVSAPAEAAELPDLSGLSVEELKRIAAGEAPGDGDPIH